MCAALDPFKQHLAWVFLGGGGGVVVWSPGLFNQPFRGFRRPGRNFTPFQASLTNPSEGFGVPGVNLRPSRPL